MPIMTYTCGRHTFDELFLGTETVPDTMSCTCGRMAERRTVYRTSILGPVFEHLETYEKALYSPRERAQGKRIRTAKDIVRAENEQGIYREDDTFYRVARDEQRHDSWQIKKAGESGGRDGALDFVEDMNIKDKTGWDDRQLNTWKEDVRAVEATVQPPAEAGQ